jgi:hypothetical protein
MRKQLLAQLLFGTLAVLALGCGDVPMKPGHGTGGRTGTGPGAGGATGTMPGFGGAAGGAIGHGGALGSGGVLASGGTGGTFVFSLPDGGFPPLPDGGLVALLGDSGIIGGILDAPRDSLLGQIICGPEAKVAAPCATGSQACVLPSLGGACLCVSGIYLCPADTTSGPQTCPANAATGVACSLVLTTCTNASVACICGLGTYSCF